MSDAINRSRCPLCQADNDCGTARGASTCWCFANRIPEDVLERVPPELRDQACICERCAAGRRSTTEVRTIADTRIS